MSNRDSLGFGDLLPQDVVNIFVREKNGKRGRKKRTRSLGRAFGWLKRRKSRKLSANGQGPGLGPALDLALDGLSAGQQGGNKGGHKSTRHAHPQGNSHAVSKRENEDQTLAPPPFLENVFVEASRPKYLEDLHSEALEGLKLMQQEESSKGVEYQDNESTISTVTTQTDGESAGFVTDSTLPDSSSVVSAQSSVSAMSSRSGLTRQESTFRPLNSGKKEKGKKRRRQRRTIVGIPHHVQRELGLDRTGWMLNPPLQEEHLYNGETDNGFTSDDQQNAESTEEAATSITAVKNLQPLSKDNVEQLGATLAGHGDDLTLLHRFNSGLTRGQRPQSLAVPWMTTASGNQKLSPGAVMSMSPQAAYMSKIIPNAVLPPSIEVVEISRGQSRSSVRTVTKSSLVVSSPNSSRPSSRASSSRSTLSNITSASRCILPSTSGSSLWSNSESSETLVSDTSTIFSSSTAQQNKSPYGEASAKEDKVGPISSNYSQNGKIVLKGGEKNAQFGRSMSIKKPKRAPPPPSRSYSLHNKIKRRSRDLMELQPSTSGRPSFQSEENNNIIGLSSVPSKNGDSPGYHGDTSSLDESSASVVFPFIKPHSQEPKTEVRVEVEKVSKEVPREKQENKRNKTRPPPTGSSKQEPTPLQVSKEVQGSSTKHKKSIFAKWFSGSHSPAVPKAEAKVQEKPKLTEELNPEAGTASTHPSVRTLRDLFNIPPSPKVHAPPPPPPEVWAHSKRTFELIFGPPAPIDPAAIIKKNPKDRRHQRQSSSVSTEGSTKGSVVERKHKNPAEKLEASDNQSFQESRDLRTECDDKKNNEELEQNEGLKEKDEKVRVGDVLNGMLVKVIERRQRTEENQNVFIEGKSSVGELPAPTIVSISSSSPPPESHLPHHPCTGQTMDATSGQVVSPESFWPPPPPPLTQIGISGSDEADLPLPPPPLFGEEGLSSPSPPEAKAAHVDVITAKPKNLCPPEEVMLSPLKIPPPPSYTAPPPPAEVSPQHEVVPAPKSEALPGKEVTTLATAAEEASLPPAVEAFHPLPDKVAAPPSQEDAFQAITQAAPESKLTPPQSVPPPPSSLSQQQEEIPLEQEGDSSNSFPPQIIPPPLNPPVQTVSEITSASDEPPPSPPCDFRNSPVPKYVEEPAPSPPQSIPLPPPLPESGLVSTKLQSSPVSQEDQSQKQMAAAALPEEPSSHITPSLLNAVKLRSVSCSPEPPEARQQTSDSHKEASPIITQTLLQTVKLRSVNNSPEPPEAKDQPETEVKLNQEQPESQAPTSSAPADPPQKPVRRSLILGASTSPSPPVDAAPQPTLPTSQSVSAPEATTVSIAKPSPPVAACRSMNLQEAIRMRTAARSKENPSSSLNLHPTSPSNLQKSPTSTANFIFSKINKKAEDKTVLETKIQPRNQEVSSVTKIPSVEEPVKKEAKVPPPVAKKPRTESKGAEINEDTEQTAGQEAQKGVKEPEE